MLMQPMPVPLFALSFDQAGVGGGELHHAPTVGPGA